MLATKEQYLDHPNLYIVPKKVDRFLPAQAFLVLAEENAREQKSAFKENQPRHEKIIQFINPLKRKLKEQPITATENYLRRFFGDKTKKYQLKEAKTAVEQRKIFEPDYWHIFLEMIRVEKKTAFPMKISAAEQAAHGEGYKEAMTLMLANFVHEIGKQGLSGSRSILEHLVFQRNYNQLLQIAQQHLNQLAAQGQLDKNQPLRMPTIGTLITSPPGMFEDGYHGIDTLTNWKGLENHHSFHFWHLIKQIDYTIDAAGLPQVATIDVEVTQFRTWHNMQGLLDLQQKLGEPIQVEPDQPITHQILANAHQLHFEPDATEAEMLAYFDQLLYEGQDKWAKNPDQAPKLSPEAEKMFWEEVMLGKVVDGKQIESFFDQTYLKPVLKLLESVSAEELENPKTRQRVTAVMDLRARCLLRAIELRVRELNTNPNYNQLVKQNLLRQLLKNPFDAPTIVEQLKNVSDKETGVPLTDQDRLEKFKTLFNFYQKTEIWGEKLTSEEAGWIRLNAGSVFAVGDFAFGSMQCFTVATVTMPFKLAEMASMGAVSGSLTEAFSLVDTETKRKELENIRSMHYVELDLRPKAKQVWMVPASYLTDPGCRVDDRGVVCGPCITPDFPFGIPFDHPLEAANPYGPLAMNQSQFDQYLKSLEESILRDELAEQLGIDDMSDEDKLYVKTLTDRLIKTLFKVSLTTLIAGVTDYDDQALRLPEATLKQITDIATLEQLVLQLEKDDNKTELEVLEKVTDHQPQPYFLAA